MPETATLVFAGKSVATPAISFLVTKAFNYLREYCNAEGMEEVESQLLQAMPNIQAVFDVVNPERIREQSSALDAWLWQLRDTVEEAEDAIDELEYYELEEKAKDRKVCDYGSSFARMRHKVVKSVKHASILDKTVKQFSRHGTLKRLRKAVCSLDKAAAGVAVFLTLTDHLKGVASSIQQQEQLGNNDRETGSTLCATKFVGRRKEKEQIIGWLNKTSVESAQTVTSTNSVPVISVVGHCGMGKTTLAQSVCEEDEIRKHFQVIWVTVSTSFDATSVTSKILECATRKKPSANHLEPLQQDLKAKLQFITFLLVLDDVWEDKKIDEWEKLFAPMRKVKTRSKILLTTRMRSVADMAAMVMGVERDQCLTLEGLEEDENIELFNHHVFSGLNPQNYVHLKSIGEQIVKKLGGCPLVTKVVSGHLQGNMTLEYWSRFMHEGLEHFKGTDEDIMKVLRLSYYHLPTDLQICFRYCSLFPQVHEFKKKELVQMWMGSGLISQVTSGSQTFEDIGGQFLDQLTRKSFFDQKSALLKYGTKEVEYYVMHDLMHDLARNASYGECSRITDPGGFEGVKDTVRHLCVAHIHECSVELIGKISQFKNLRSIIVDSQESINKDMVCTLEKVVQTSKSLRLFHSRLSNTFNFADRFGNFKHLRYLYLHQMSPEGISRVAKLYHLMLLRCDNSLQGEAKEVRYFGNLEQLRYVSYGVRGLGEFPVSRLTNLQELENYRVRGSIGNKISSVGNMRSLRKLQVQGIENIENHEEAKDAKLKEKQHLSSLSLEWSASTGLPNRRDDLVLDHLEPHGNIRELRISGYEGVRLPFWIENPSVKNLVSLRLERCINLEHLPSLGELVLLKRFILEDLPKLQQIGRSSDTSSSNGMELSLPPCLDNLEVQYCQELKELPILPPTLVRFKICHVGLTKLPSIGMLCGKSTETKPSELLHITVKDCPCLTSLEGSLLEQREHMGALGYLCLRDCMNLESAALPYEEMNELVELAIVNCPILTTPRGAGDKLLPSSLARLITEQCGNLELALLGSLQRLTNLSWLELRNCSGLGSLPSADLELALLGSLPSLIRLVISGCVNLSSLGGLGSLPSLAWLDIDGCENLSSLGGLGSLPSLSELKIIRCKNLSSLGGLGCLPSLEVLIIRGCGNLSSLGGLGSLPSLGRLVITGCSKLAEVGSSHQIDSLYIDLPSLLLVESLRSLSRTQKLHIDDGSEMESLPEWWLLQNRKSLRLLSIREAKSLESLPPSMRDLSSLKELCLSGAGQLRSLPDLPSSCRGSVFRDAIQCWRRRRENMEALNGARFPTSVVWK